mgnify:CR=1 FL=1
MERLELAGYTYTYTNYDAVHFCTEDGHTFAYIPEPGERASWGEIGEMKFIEKIEKLAKTFEIYDDGKTFYAQINPGRDNARDLKFSQ